MSLYDDAYCTCHERKHACSPPCDKHPERGGGLDNPGVPECTCGVVEGTQAYTAYDGNWGGHAVDCPRRDYANIYERYFAAGGS